MLWFKKKNKGVSELNANLSDFELKGLYVQKINKKIIYLDNKIMSFRRMISHGSEPIFMMVYLKELNEEKELLQQKIKKLRY